MATRYPEPFTTPKLKETQSDISVPEESHVRLSPRVIERREQVAGLLNGRFLDMYNLSRETHEQFGLLY